jgi:hypothetical protein
MLEVLWNKIWLKPFQEYFEKDQYMNGKIRWILFYGMASIAVIVVLSIHHESLHRLAHSLEKQHIKN